MSQIGVSYIERSAQFSEERERYESRLRWIERGRLVTFLAAVACLTLIEMADSLSALLRVGATLSSISFIILVVAHRRTAGRIRWYGQLQQINDEAQQRIERNWKGLPVLEVEPPPPGHPFADDLNLFGQASLFQLICTAATAPGRETIRDWLLEPATRDTISERQRAVAELAPLVDFRDKLTARGRLCGEVRRQPLRQFELWAKGDLSLPRKWWLIWAARLLPLSTVLLVGLQWVGVLRYPVWIVPLVAGLLATWSTRTIILKIFRSASSGYHPLRRLAGMFEVLSEATFKAPLLQRLQRNLIADGIAAHRQMRRLGRVLACTELRYSELLHFVVQFITMWDIHILFALERWRRDAGPHVAGWVTCLGQVEALSALAALAAGHPDWKFPEFSLDNESKVEAAGLRHPLLRPAVGVGNDMQIGPRGTMLMVTGSNMSGKSTFLKAVGVNVVLAQAGGPVCAFRFRLPTVTLCTSMHVRDSLEQGVSQFMAELKRLKQIVDAAQNARAEGTTVLYLLDEILQGTNAAERQTAVRGVVRHLLRQEAIGAISSHDLALADTETLDRVTHRVYFREEIHVGSDRATLCFDYKLRPGVATSTNALKLMEIVGLGGE